MPWLLKSVAKSSQRVVKHISNKFHKWPHYKSNSCCVVSTPVSFLPFFYERTTHTADKAVIGTIQCSNLVYSQRVLSLVVMLISIVRFKQQHNCNKFPDTVGWYIGLTSGKTESLNYAFVNSAKMNEYLAIDPDCRNDIDFKSGVMCLLFPKTHNMCVYISASTIKINNWILRQSSEQYYHHYYVVKSMNIYIVGSSTTPSSRRSRIESQQLHFTYYKILLIL